MEGKHRKYILILDPERDTADLFTRALETHSQNCKCYWAQTVIEARSLLSEMDFSFLVADYSLLQRDHFRLLDALPKIDCKTTVLVSAYPNEQEQMKRMPGVGVTGCFTKPIKISFLRKLIDDLSDSPAGSQT